MTKPKLPSKSKPRTTKTAKTAPPRKTASKVRAAKTEKPRKRDKAKAVAMAVAVHELAEQAKNGTAGRPEDYKPQYAVLAEKMCLLNVGITDVDLAKFFEVSEATIHNWKQNHPEFLESIRNGKDISDLEVAHGLYRRAMGATFVIEKEVKRKVVEYENGKKCREEEFIEVVPLVQQAPPDAVAAKYWLSNRRRKEKSDRQWVDKVELTHNGGDNPIKTEEVDMGFARKLAFMLERSTRMAKPETEPEEPVTE